jgi:Flp pilus assembly protein TadG
MPVRKLAKYVWRFKNTQQGAALVLVALSVVALIGFAALAVDGGYLYFRHTRLQDISDSAAIAAGIEVVETGSKTKVDAFDAAIDYVKLHGLETANENNSSYTATIKWGTETGDMIVSFPEENLSKIMVQINLEANTFYARVLGTSSTPVGVTSVVQIGRAKQQQGNLVPVGIYDSEYERGVRYELTYSPSDHIVPGNYGLLDFGDYEYVDEHGKKQKLQFEDFMKFGYPGTLAVGDIIKTQPGIKEGKAEDINDRNERCTDKKGYAHSPACTYESYQEPCSKIIVLPIVETVQTDPSGKHDVRIVGFAKFFFDGYEAKGDKNANPPVPDNVLYGYFLEQLVPSQVAEGDDQFTTQAVNLIR